MQVYMPPSLQQQRTTLAQAPVPLEDIQRKQEMRDAWRAYRGRLPKPLKIEEDKLDDNVRNNRCRPIVDKGVSFLFGNVVKIEASEETTEEDTQIQDFIESFWGDDDTKMTLLAKAATNGGVCGHVFLKLIPPQGRQKYPRIVILDPLLVRIVTDPDDCSTVWAYIIEYGRGQYFKRQIIARIDPNADTEALGETLDDTWTITNYVRRQDSQIWIQAGESEEWDYPFPPIFDTQNLPAPNEAWGTPDLTEDLIEMNSVLNFVQSNTSRIIRFYAHPRHYGTGLVASQIQVAVGEILCLPNPDSALHSLEMQSDLSSSLNFASTLRSDMDEQSRVPAVALGRLEAMPSGDIPGITMQLMFQPLTEKTIQKQRLYGTLIRQVTRAAMALSGLLPIEEYEDYPINLHWQPALPSDELKQAQGAVILKQVGVSDDTLLRQLGYDPEEEKEKSQQEDAAKLEAFARGQGMPPEMPGQPGQGMPPTPGQGSPFLGRGQ